MDASDVKLRCTIIFVIFELWHQQCYSYDIRCPRQSEWGLKASAKCGNVLEYFCLLDDNANTYIDLCKENPDINRDITWKKGHKSVFRGNLDGEVCTAERYQPFKFRTDGNSNCAFKKSLCQDEGMSIYTNGSTTLDTHCRCDHTKGYAFVSKTKYNCYCVPSDEDCSCYKKKCESNFKLSSDYNCIFLNSQKDQSACTSFDRRPLIDIDSRNPDLKQKNTDVSSGNDMTLVVERHSVNIFFMTAIIVFTVIIAMVFWKCYEQIMKCIGTLIETKFGTKRRKIDQTNYKVELKQQTANYMDIITGIHTDLVVDELTLLPDDNKQSIEVCQGRRQKNKKLLEIVLDGGIFLYNEFITKIRKSDSNRTFGNKIVELTGFKVGYPSSGRDFINILEENLLNVKIPEDVRNVSETYLKTWYKNDKKFTVTTASYTIERNLKQNKCVLLVGRSGNGKSAIIRHIALKLFNEEGYDVVPNVSDLSMILRYHDPHRKQLFVLDDFCGKVETNDQTVQMSSIEINDVLKLIKNNPTNPQGSLKLLFSTQPFMFENSSFNSDDCLSKYKIDLTNYPLQDSEKIEMIRKYLPKDHVGNVPAISSHNKDIVPLLCKLSEGKTTKHITQLFNDPVDFIKKDFAALNQTNKTQMCLLTLCVLFKSLTKDIFSPENTNEKKKITEVVCSEFDLDCRNEKTQLKLIEELANIEKSYFENAGDIFYFVHKDVYNIAAVCCGEILKNTFIRFAYSSFIAERYSFFFTKRKNIIYIGDEETQKKYFNRLRTDLEQGTTYSTFHNSQLEDTHYRQEFCAYCKDKRPTIVKILNRLRTMASESPTNRNYTPPALRKEIIHESKDYIDFTHSCQFASHNLKLPLIESAWEGHEEIVKMLIDLERDVNETDKFGRSALFVACYRGKINVVKLLLGLKAELSKCDDNEKSPLYAACEGGHTQIVKVLLDYGANPSKCDKNGFSPLHAASAAGHRDILPLLLTKDNVNYCDNLSRSALFVATDNGRKGVVKLLLEKKANINECDSKGFSPLMAACSKGHSGVVDVLVNAEAQNIKIDDQDNKGRSALFIASKKGHDEIVNLLLMHKADVLRADCHGQSPLFIASYVGNEDVVRLLIKNIKTISQTDEDGKTPLFIACEKGKEKIVDILLPKYSLEELLKTDNKERSPIYVACRGGFIGIVKKLARKGAQTNKHNMWTETPLFAASRGGHADVVRYLIDNNADLNYAESNGHTPLWIACDEENVEIVKILVDKGADINLKDNDNRTPLDVARIRENTEIENILLQKRSAETKTVTDVKE